MFLPSKALLHAAENCFEEDSKKTKNENRIFIDTAWIKIRVFDPYDVWSKVEEIKHMWTIFQSDKNESEDRKFMDKWLNDSRIFYGQYNQFAKAFEKQINYLEKQLNRSKINFQRWPQACLTLKLIKILKKSLI